MAFTPSSWVYLLDTPLDNTYKNELHFETISAQRSYFNSRIRHRFDDVPYNHKDSFITVNKHIDSLLNSNYVMYCNEPLSNHYFYAFITKMEYVSDYVTNIYIETDVYQTWLFDCSLKKSFVVREHVANDAIGANVVDEGIEYGEYKVNSYTQTNALGDLWFIMAVSDTISDSETVIRGIYGNVYSGLAFFAYAPDDYADLSTHINNYVNAGKGDAIQFIYTLPRNLLPESTVSGGVIPNGLSMGELVYEYPTFTTNLTELNRFKKLDGYIPVNKKMYCAPYNVLYVSNNSGSSAEYHFEDFINFEMSDKLQFYIEGSITPNPTIMIYPYWYKVSNTGTAVVSPEYGLQLTGYPLCSWGNDTFNAWLAQNGVSTAVAVIGSAGAMIGGAVTGNVGAVAGGAFGVISQMQQLYKASLQPDQAKGNTNGGSLNIANGRQDFSFSRLTIRNEYAKRIDDFFSMFGYKVNNVKVPNTHSRENWNYIQTIDVNIDGSIPADDMKKLKSIYNNGVTLWHNADNFCHYEMSNEII